MNFNDYKFHPSSLGKIMTGSRNKGEIFGETAKAHLIECYINHVYGRYNELTNKYIEKGTEVEEDSLDLYSYVKDKMFVKNKEVFTNESFIGTPDIIDGDTVIDIKSSWNIFTFYSNFAKALNKDYVWQLQAYMDLLHLDKAKLVYCLVNTPLKLIEDEKKKLMWRMGVIDTDTDENYLKACEEIDKNCIYDDIPMEKRYIEITIDRDQELIDSAHERVKLCREFLNQLPI